MTWHDVTQMFVNQTKKTSWWNTLIKSYPFKVFLHSSNCSAPTVHLFIRLLKKYLTLILFAFWLAHQSSSTCHVQDVKGAKQTPWGMPEEAWRDAPLKNIFFDVLPINLWANQVASSSSSSSPASSSSSSSTSKNIKQIKNIKHLLSPKASRSSPIRNFTPKRYTHHTSTHNLGTRSLGKRSQTTLNRISKSGLRLWKTKFCQPWSLGLTTRWKV